MPRRQRLHQPDSSPAPGGNTRPHLPAEDFEARRSPPAVKNATSGSHRCPCLPLQTAGPFRSALVAVRRKPGGGEPPRGLRALPPRASGWVPTRPTKRLDHIAIQAGVQIDKPAANSGHWSDWPSSWPRRDRHDVRASSALGPSSGGVPVNGWALLPTPAPAGEAGSSDGDPGGGAASRVNDNQGLQTVAVRTLPDCR
jgi:hypothetical protein